MTVAGVDKVSRVSAGCSTRRHWRPWKSAHRSVVLVLSLLCAPVAHAGTFELTTGKQFEVCRAFKKNLGAFPNLSKNTYEWPLDPKLTDFKKPEWKRVDIKQHMDMIKTLYEWNYNPANIEETNKFADEAWTRASQRLPDEIENGFARLEEAHIDFDNDGRADTVYRYFHRMLPDQQRYFVGKQPVEGYWYKYLDARGDLTPERFRVYSRYGKFYDSFLYRGRFYLIAWYKHLTIFEPRRIPELSLVALIDVCHFDLLNGNDRSELRRTF